jgi:hypothetical protein
VRPDPCQREMSVLRLLINLHGPDRANPEAQVFLIAIASAALRVDRGR